MKVERHYIDGDKEDKTENKVKDKDKMRLKKKLRQNNLNAVILYYIRVFFTKSEKAA